METIIFTNEILFHLYMFGFFVVVIINSLDGCGINLLTDRYLGHYPSYNIFPTDLLLDSYIMFSTVSDITNYVVLVISDG